MTEWHPPKQTGLSGDRYLSEDLEAFVDDLADAHEPAVYALKLSVPSDWETVEQRWDDAYDVERPEWIRSAFESAGVIYVGGAKDLHDRVTEHLENPNRSASICHVFPIHTVWDVWFFEDADRAFERESGIAIDLRNKFPYLHVHQA